MQWLNADGSPMTEYCWHNRGSKAIQVVLDDEWLLLVNAKRSRQLFNLLKAIGKFLAYHLRNLITKRLGNVLLEHMGIWILHKTN